MPPPPPPPQPRAGGFPQSHLQTLHDDPYPLCWGVTPKPLGQPFLPVAWGQAMGQPYCCGAVLTLTFGDTPCPPPGVGPTPNPQGSPATRRAVPSSPPNPASLWHQWGCGVPPPPKSPPGWILPRGNGGSLSPKPTLRDGDGGQLCGRFLQTSECHLGLVVVHGGQTGQGR